MIVDDAVVARGHMRHWITSDPSLNLVGSFANAREAVDQMGRLRPDVVVLDLEMPGLDGISALPQFLQRDPSLAIIVASAITRGHAEIGLKALALGALDCIPKPDAAHPESLGAFRHDLMTKIHHLGARRQSRRFPRVAAPRPARRNAAMAPVTVLPSVRENHRRRFSLRPFPPFAPRVVVVGASTGGPQALTALGAGLATLGQHAPVLIAQHMPPMFTTILAEHLGRTSGRPTTEAQDGEPVLAGRTYLAPGGLHMRVVRRKGTAVIALDDGPLLHHCRPAVDPLFSSAAEIWGSLVLGVVLTGMGSDGTDGAASIVSAGGCVIAQDEASSVVWGMPGSVADAGLCSAVLPLDDIAAKIVHLVSGSRA